MDQKSLTLLKITLSTVIFTCTVILSIGGWGLLKVIEHDKQLIQNAVWQSQWKGYPQDAQDFRQRIINDSTQIIYARTETQWDAVIKQLDSLKSTVAELKWKVDAMEKQMERQNVSLRQ